MPKSPINLSPRINSRILLLVCSLTALSSFAQDNVSSSAIPIPQQNFSLFETLDSANNNSASSASNGRNPQNSRGTRATQAEPVFTLVGTSRIGNKQKALLRHSSGEVVQVPLAEGINTVPGHELYAIVNYGAGQVALRYPTAVPCADFPDQGVSCDSNTNISSLSITTADAIATIQPAQPIAEEVIDIQSDSAPSATDTTRNPFAAIRDRGRAATQASSTSQFQPRRIAPEDVPPGKRVVSTPFGDRLVDI